EGPSEALPADREGPDVAVGDQVRHSRLLGQDRHLADDVPGAPPGHFHRLLVASEDPNVARDDDVHRVPRIVLPRDDRAIHLVVLRPLLGHVLEVLGRQRPDVWHLMYGQYQAHYTDIGVVHAWTTC